MNSEHTYLSESILHWANYFWWVNNNKEFSVSCGPFPSGGKVGPSSGVDGRPGRCESQQNCAGLGAEWGIPPAGIGDRSETGTYGAASSPKISPEMGRKPVAECYNPLCRFDRELTDGKVTCCWCGEDFCATCGLAGGVCQASIDIKENGAVCAGCRKNHNRDCEGCHPASLSSDAETSLEQERNQR